MTNKDYPFTLKLKSWVLDFLIFYIVAIPFIIINLAFHLDKSIAYNSFMLALLYGIIICKDLPSSQSFGKRKNNLKVVNINNSTPNPFKLIMRNIIFILTWPIEVTVNITNPERRLGDLICGTKVIKLESPISGKFIFGKKNILIFL